MPDDIKMEMLPTPMPQLVGFLALMFGYHIGLISCYMYSCLEIRATQRTQAWDACRMGYSIMNNPLVLNYTVELLSRLERGEPGNEDRTTSQNYTIELHYWSTPPPRLTGSLYVPVVGSITCANLASQSSVFPHFIFFVYCCYSARVHFVLANAMCVSIAIGA